MLLVAFSDPLKVLAVAGFFEAGGLFQQGLLADPALAVGNFFQTGDFQALAVFDGLHKVPGFQQGVVGAGIQPGKAPAQHLDIELALIQVGHVHIGDFQLAPGGGLDIAGNLDHLVVVEVEAGDRIGGFGLGGFFFNAQGAALFIEFHHAEALGVGDVVAKHGGAFLTGDGGLEFVAEVLAVEDIVAEDEADIVIADKVGADGKGLGQAVGAGLLFIADVNPELAAITEQALEAGQVGGGRDDQDIANPRQHQHRQGVVDHRLIVERQQLLRAAHGDGVEPGAGATCEDNTFT